VRGSRALALAAGIAILAAFVLRPVAHGVAWETVAVFWAIALGQAIVPGVLLCHGARLCAARDSWLLLGQGTTIGLSIQGLAVLGGRALGAHWLPTLAALGTAAAGLALARRAPRRGAGDAPRASALTLAVVLFAVLLQPLASTGRLGEPVPFDLLFHAGVAGELRHRWPLEDPRVAGVPLHYHLLAYALPVEAADRAGAPVADPLLGLAPLLWVGLLALQVSNAGRVVFRDGRAGALGAAVALLHTDPGQFLGLGPGAFNSHLATGIFGSPTTACGLVLLAGLTVSLESWVEAGGRGHLAALALLAAAASGAKTTVLPVVVGGLALASGRALVLRNPIALRRWVAALVVAAAAGAPLTLWQTSGEASYSGMARFGPGTAFSSSGFASACTRWIGPGGTHGPAAAASLALWLAGYLGLAGVAAASWLARREERLRETQVWALAVFAVGLAATLLLDVPGLSQLFLLYNGQLLLCLFAGAGLARAARWPRGRLEAATAVLLALAALPVVHHAARALPASLRGEAAAAASATPPVVREYGEGLAWLRDRASQDAVVFADNPSLLLSAFGEIRLYYETGLYTARAWQVGPSREPWPERAALQERLLRRPDAAAVAEARRVVGPGPRLLVAADAVASRVESGFVLASPGPVPQRRLFPADLFDLRFANRALHVYEAREPAPRPYLSHVQEPIRAEPPLPAAAVDAAVPPRVGHYSGARGKVEKATPPHRLSGLSAAPPGPPRARGAAPRRGATARTASRGRPALPPGRRRRPFARIRRGHPRGRADKGGPPPGPEGAVRTAQRPRTAGPAGSGSPPAPRRPPPARGRGRRPARRAQGGTRRRAQQGRCG